jgi:arylsulfatase A-like enzyme
VHGEQVTSNLGRPRPNVLLITLDQFRGDCLSVAGHPIVKTPALDSLAADGARLTQHYSQAAPCGPGRAALYTGTYQMNNRVVANGTPLDDRFDNVARMARRAGYSPVLFGYTDQAVDPRTVEPGDPRLSTYEGVLPGFDVGLDLTSASTAWLDHLRVHGHDEPDFEAALAKESSRPVELSVSRFLTDSVLAFVGSSSEPWFVHASYLRPHPPYNAAGEYSTMYDAADVVAAIEVGEPATLDGFHLALLSHHAATAPTGPALAELTAQYYGMISHVDAEIGRLIAHLKGSGAWDHTVIVVTSDHGEQLGDHGLIGKLGFVESSYRILGIVRDPAAISGGHAGVVVDRFTENVDLFPTLCELVGEPIPLQCDGLALTPLLRSEEPLMWRDAAHWEWDWRFERLEQQGVPPVWPWDRRLERSNLAVRRSAKRAYVSFGDGSAVCFDLGNDPSWRTVISDPEQLLQEANAMLAWRAEHLDRSLASVVLVDGGKGRPIGAIRPND